MDYDQWKQQTPDSYDYEEGNTCSFCGVGIKDDKQWCSKECKKAEFND